mgnify:CR=1 FL=1
MRRLFGAVVIAFILSAVPAYKAWALVCCDPWGFVGHTAFIQAGTAVMSTITASVASIVNVMQLQMEPSWGNGFGKQMSELQKQTATQRVFRQGTVAVQSQLYMQELAGDAAERSVVPAQQSVTVTNAALMAEQSNVVRDKITRADQAFVAGIYGTRPADSSIVIERHKPYCSAADQARGRCETLASPTMQNADLTINTIFNPGDGQYETLTDEEHDAANAFVRNVANPIPGARLSSDQNKSEQVKAVDAELLADQAALSVVGHTFNAAIAHRTRRRQQ